jgi:hypothetical protein
VISYKDYIIDSDQYQFILRQTVVRKKKDTGEEYTDEATIGFYRDMPQVIAAIQRHMTLDKFAAEDMTLTEALEYCKQTWADIKNALEGKV